MRPDTVFIGSEIYRTSRYGRRHPLAIPRVSTVMDLCRALGWLDDDSYIESPIATTEQLCRFHDPAYVAAVMEAERTQKATPELIAKHNIGKLENPVYGEIFRRPATAAGASLLAADLVAEGRARRVHTPAGGTHHGRPDRASGFCYFNDPVLAILRLQDHGAGRIAYVDVDAHHCDGVEDATHDDPSVLTLSIHEHGRWPHRAETAHRQTPTVGNWPLPRGSGDALFRQVFEGELLPRVTAFAPEVVIMQCGADALADDPLSRLELSNRAIWRAVRDVAPFHGQPGDLWRISVKPSDAPDVLARLEPEAALMDWGGGLIWAALPGSRDARGAMEGAAGHATLVRGNGFPRFHPEPAPVAKLADGLRAKFDPRGILNPGLMR